MTELYIRDSDFNKGAMYQISVSWEGEITSVSLKCLTDNKSIKRKKGPRTARTQRVWLNNPVEMII